ncbi:SDR family NAD(P)-dependent oxidoreductase [Novosphingobium sp. FKTRR1]|uniref:SDR family NAD(P)-dependent oxidoreductase n=1 Tax=Novosphingobium sp. FKTRR1 TaxID=2879118 RepID=UPI001CF0C2C2|nr:SDR family NAD(P)-dependent oxidoreductase [Novosphingobium sp. FKTRR1]
MGQLEGRRALVTGAADGIGKAITEAFAREGAQVLAIDVSGDKLNEAFARDAAIIPIVQDITAADAAEALTAKLDEFLCGLDILVNNAGIPGELALLQETTDANWHRVFAVNVDAVFRLTRACIPLLQSSKCGRIITTASVCAEYGLRLQGAYVASKHAVSGLMKGFAIELGQYGITANCINPANTVTGITRDWFSPVQSSEGRAYLDVASVLGRYSNPEDIAAAALYLASDGGGYVTGQSITVDGGMTCRLPSLSHATHDPTD